MIPGIRILLGLACAGAPLSAASTSPGLIGVLYTDSEMTRPGGRLILSRLDHQQAEWPQNQDWSLRLRGYLTPPVSGPITLVVETRQHARLILDGKEILDVTGGEATTRVEAVAGTPLAMILELAQESPPSEFRMRWQLPGQPAAPLPASALSHDQADRAVVDAADTGSRGEQLLAVLNPDPDALPSLEVWRRNDELLVGATFPGVPDFTCDSWCYEGGMDFIGCRDRGNGRLELRHRLTATPDVLVVTDVIPHAGAVEFLAQLERVDGREGPWPAAPPVPNLCWQLKRAPDFASQPEPYPEFIARCFIFTAGGRTFLDQTTRRPIPVRASNDRRNTPPWVQIYGPAWKPPQRSGPEAWADYSPDRFTCSIVGTVSRDGAWLAAIAAGSAQSLCQAWHDCMHINSSWSEPDRASGARTWRLKVYLMKNDPARLLSQALQDFPEMRSQPAFLVNAQPPQASP